MLRKVGAVLAVLLCGLVLAQAEEIRGKVKSTDPDKNTITVTVNDKDQTLPVAKEAKIYQLVGKKLKKAKPEDVVGGLGGLKSGTEVMLTTDKKDGKEEVTEVKVEGLKKKKKKNQ